MVTHAISATYSRFDRMSPTAAALAVLLHVATALALWWVSPLNRNHPEEEPIEVTIEQPRVEQPKPPPPLPQAPPQPAPPPPAPTAAPKPPPPAASAPLGLPPPAPKTGDTRQQAAPKGEPEPKAEPNPEPPKAEAPKPEPQQQAVAPPAPKPEPTPAPPIEKILPPLEAPPPPITSRDFPTAPTTPPPPKPAPPTTPPQARPAPAPPPPQQQIKPSPLQTSPMKRVPDSQSNESSETFVNPSARYSQSKLTDDYIWQVVHKFSQYLPDLRQKGEGGSLSLRFVIARDGRLVDVAIVKSSGVLALDRGMLDAVRAAAPYPPFPSELSGNQVTYTLPLTARENR
jgi:protein TonB